MVLWLAFFVLVGTLLTLDLLLFHRRPHALGFREAGLWTVFWTSIGLSFAGVVFAVFEYHWFGFELGTTPGEVVGGGGQAALQYVSGYLLEWSLSVDNLFVMAVIFRRYAILAEYQHRVLFWGILGAVVFRLLLILGGVALVERFAWSFYVLGAYLMLLAVRMVRHTTVAEIEKERVLRLIRRFYPVSTDDHEGQFFAVEGGRRVATRTFLALVSIELADVVFALDSVPAILALTTERFIVVASNVFAILGLRSLYFLLAGLLERFRHLHWSLAAILFLVGLKMLLRDVVHVPIHWSLLTIVTLLAAGILAGLVRRR